MMSDEAQYEELLAARWLGELSDEEGARLKGLIAANAALRDRWEEDMILLKGVASLPDVSVSDDFTNRVMNRIAFRTNDQTEIVNSNISNISKDQIDQINSKNRKNRKNRMNSMSLMNWIKGLGKLPKLGLGLGLVLLFVGSFFKYQQGGSAKLAESIAVLTEAEGVPSLEELRHFEAIRNLAQVPVEVDWELVAFSEKGIE